MEKAGKPSGKRHKVLDDDQNNVDRLSALPDGVICHILSFLPTKPSVSTSILAKRWRFLWAHVPVLDFYSWYRKQATSFPSIVCTVMLRHKVQNLNTFRLSCGKGCYELETCIATAIDRNVKKLELRLQGELPRCILTCKTLVDLILYGCVSIPPSSGPISLPSLKKLCFYPTKDDVHLPRLLSGCPVLEELIIYGPPCAILGGCTLSSPTLKSFTLYFPCPGTTFGYDIPGYRLKINASALRYFWINRYMYHHISFSPMNSLLEANINWSNFGDPYELYPLCLLEFLDSLCNVKCLKLSCHDAESINLPSNDLPVPGSIVKFGNLTKLELFADWCFLSKFLESADHLKVLIIHEGDCHSKHWMEPEEERCACLLYSLRIVRIDGFKRKEQSFNMVRYFLRNALVLERMEITCRRWHLPDCVGLKEKFDAIQRISLFRRGSVQCELAFS